MWSVCSPIAPSACVLLGATESYALEVPCEESIACIYYAKDFCYTTLASFLREAYGLLADDSLEVAQTKLAEGLRSLGAGEEEIERISPTVGYLLGLETGAALRHVEPEQLKRQILLAIRALCERQLEKGPLILSS